MVYEKSSNKKLISSLVMEPLTIGVEYYQLDFFDSVNAYNYYPMCASKQGYVIVFGVSMSECIYVTFYAKTRH